jgi:hypothetical protein
MMILLVLASLGQGCKSESHPNIVGRWRVESSSCGRAPEVEGLEAITFTADTYQAAQLGAMSLPCKYEWFGHAVQLYRDDGERSVVLEFTETTESSLTLSAYRAGYVFSSEGMRPAKGAECLDPGLRLGTLVLRRQEKSR